MAQGTILLGPKKDDAKSGGGGRKSRRGGSRGSDGGTIKRKHCRMATAGGKCTAGFGATAKRTPLTSMTLQSFPLCGPQ
jgi:hypothetical protein